MILEPVNFHLVLDKKGKHSYIPAGSKIAFKKNQLQIFVQ